jgi:hypothetical protein
MDKLVFPSGGMFLDAEDLEFQDAAYREAITACVKPVADLTGSSALILWGCEVLNGNTFGNNAVSHGYMLYNGEVCYFGGATNLRTTEIDGTPRRYILEYDIFSDPLGDEVLASGATGNTYQKRRVKLTKYTNQTDVTFHSDVKRYLDVLQAYIKATNSINVNIFSLFNGWTAPTDNRAKSYRTDNIVTLEGQLIAGQVSTSIYTQICTLGGSYRPIIPLLRLCIVVEKGVCSVKIDTDGKVYLIDPLNTLQNGGNVDFGGISFDANL